jgi:hypothetical protein
MQDEDIWRNPLVQSDDLLQNRAQLEKHVVQTEIAGTSGKRPFLIS